MAFYPAMSMGERILFVRENCGDLSQEEFASKLGLTKSAISGYETERRVPPDNVIKHIACVFNIDEDWLRDGVGEPFFPTPDDAIEMLFEQFGCSDFEKAFLSAYFDMPDKDRCKFSKYLEQLFHDVAKWAKEVEPTNSENVAPPFSRPPEATAPKDDPIKGAEAAYEKSLGFAPNTELSASNTTGCTTFPIDKDKEKTTTENGGGESGNNVG